MSKLETVEKWEYNIAIPSTHGALSLFGYHISCMFEAKNLSKYSSKEIFDIQIASKHLKRNSASLVLWEM